MPIGRPPDAAENRALAAAIAAYIEGKNVERLTSFTEYLLRYPSSPWRLSLLTNLGMLARQTGYFSRALAFWEEAWRDGRAAEGADARALADTAVSQWLEQQMWFGKVDLLRTGLAELEGREMNGASGRRLALVREGLWFLTHHHHDAIFSGPEALKAALRQAGRGEAADHPAIASYRPGHEGTSLGELRALATQAGVTTRAMVHTAPARTVTPGAAEPRRLTVPVPSVVHLRSGHFSAVVEARDGSYRLDDPLLGTTMWVSAAALDDEASGFVLALDSPDAPRQTISSEGDVEWRDASASEAERIRGNCGPKFPPSTDCDDDCSGSGPGAGGPPPGGPSPAGGGSPSGPAGSPEPGMAVYSFHFPTASLLLRDIPIGYAPPRGPAVFFNLRYHQRRATQPSAFTFSNVGPLWQFDWPAYVEDTFMWNGAVMGWATLHLRGSGTETYANSGPAGTEVRHQRSRAVLVRTSDDPIRYERRLTDGSVEVYDLPDRGPNLANRQIFLTRLIDPRGHSLQFTYDAQTRLVAITDALGQVSTLSYELPADPFKITKVTDPFGRTARFAYTPDGRLASITDVIGLTSSFAYESGDFLAALTTPYGTTTFTRENNWTGTASLRYVTAKDPLGGTERIEYRYQAPIPAQAPAAEVPAGYGASNIRLDYENTLYWDKRAMSIAPGDLAAATITHWLDGPAQNQVPTHVASGMHSVKRPLESRVWYRYPGQTPNYTSTGTGPRPTEEARVLDDGSTQITRATYNTQGLVTQHIDPRGREITYTFAANGIDLLEARQVTGGTSELLSGRSNYNAQHQPGTMTDASGQVTTMVYNALGLVETTTNAKGGVTSYVYDVDGYLQSMTLPMTGATTSFTRDGYGRIRTRTESDGYTVTFDYDALDRETKRTYPDGASTETAYDKLDMAGQRDRLGRWTRTFYDANRRATVTRDPLGRTTQLQWCACGTLDALVDAKGQTTRWERDLQGRVIRETRADQATVKTYTYEALSGRLKSQTDPRLQVTTYTYNIDDTLHEMVYSGTPTPVPSTSYAYDTNYRRQVSRTDETGTTLFAYGPAGALGAGRLASTDGPLLDDTVTYTYDELGRLTARQVNGVGTSYVYDALDRVVTETNALGAFTRTYHGTTWRLASVSYPNGQSSSYAYYGTVGDRHLQTIHNYLPGGATLSRFDYTYDAAGQVVTWRQQAGSDPAVEWKYTYDAADQLRTAVKWSTSTPAQMLTRYAYSYDVAANRVSEQVNDVVRESSYDVLNRLQQSQAGGPIRLAGAVNEPAVVTIQGRLAAVDASGNFSGWAPLVAGTNVVTVAATDPSGNVQTRQFEIDAAGPLRAFTYDANGNLTGDGERSLAWDVRNHPLAIENVQAGWRSEFTHDGAGRLVKSVLHDGAAPPSETSWVWAQQEILEERTASGVTRSYAQGMATPTGNIFLTRDHLGSVRDVTYANGTLAARFDYDPFGRSVRTAGSLDVSVGFAGLRIIEPRAPFLFTRYRFYSPDEGRWLSRDPLRNAEFREGPNLYAYARNDPMNRVDPLGLDSPRCDMFPDSWETPCVLECCAVHDRCYKNEKCSFTSWCRNARPEWIGSVCNMCNLDAAGCIMECWRTKRGDDPNRPDCYDAKSGNWMAKCPPPPPPPPPPPQCTLGPNCLNIR